MIVSAIDFLCWKKKNHLVRKLLQDDFFIYKNCKLISRVLSGKIPLQSSISNICCHIPPATYKTWWAHWCLFCGIAPNRVYTDGLCLHNPGGLLPHLFTFALLLFFSVALSLELPPADVIRYSCPWELGLSSKTIFRTCFRDCTTCKKCFIQILRCPDQNRRRPYEPHSWHRKRKNVFLPGSVWVGTA